MTSSRHLNGTFTPYLFGGKDVFDLMDLDEDFTGANVTFVRLIVMSPGGFSPAQPITRAHPNVALTLIGQMFQ